LKIIDRAARDACRRQFFQPVGGGPRAQFRADNGVDLGLRRVASGLPVVFGFAQGGKVDAVEESLRAGIADACHDDVAIRSRVAVVRYVDEVAVAYAGGHDAGHQVLGGNVVQQRDLRVQHRHIHMLAAHGALALGDGGQHADGAEQAATQVAYRYAAAGGALLGCARDGHAASHRLHHLVERGTLRIGPGAAEPGHRAGDDARVDRAQRCVIDAETLGDAHTEIVENHVGAAYQVFEHGQARFAFQVDAYAVLVPVQRQVVRAHAVAGIVGIAFQQPARAFPMAGRLDLDGTRAQVGKQHGAVGAGQHVGQVQYGDVFKRQIDLLRVAWRVDAWSKQGSCQFTALFKILIWRNFFWLWS